MAQKKDLEWYLHQARRIAEHREEGAEEAIRKEFKKLLKDLKSYIADVHEKYAADDGSLSFADLQKAGYDARFLEEIEKRISVATPKVAKELHQLVNDTYELSYKSMIEGVEKVAKGADIGDVFSEAVAITPEQIRKVVSNPIMEVALEKNHRDIVYDIKQAVAVGLMNGDRYSTIAKKITVALDKENGPYKNAIRIARTEAHRVREAGNNDAAAAVDKELQKSDTGLRMVKTWKTMKDERVRPQRRRKGRGGWSSKMGKGANHMKLEGQMVIATEPFDLGGGVTAMAPGQSGVAGHDINCRCYASFEMMTDEGFFAATGKHFPDYKGKREETKKKVVEKAVKKEKVEKAAEKAVEKTAFKPASTVEDARQYALNTLGLKSTNYSMLNVDVANMVNKEIQSMYNVFGNINEAGHLGGIYVMTGKKSFVAAYSAPFKEVILLRSNVGYKNSIKKMSETAKRMKEIGFWSTGDAEHFVRHEVGHAIQHWLTDNDAAKLNKISVLRQQVMKDCGITNWSMSDSKENIAKAGNVLSYYALQKDGEFIAEAIAEYMAGNPRSVAKKVVEILLEGR